MSLSKLSGSIRGGRFPSWFPAIALALGWCGAASGGEAQSKAESPAKPYPLAVCVVSDEKLGGMGEPTVIQYEGREVRLCCDGCEKDFRKEPKKYLAKLDEAAKAAVTRPTTQPRPGANGGHGDHKH